LFFFRKITISVDHQRESWAASNSYACISWIYVAGAANLKAAPMRCSLLESSATAMVCPSRRVKISFKTAQNFARYLSISSKMNGGLRPPPLRADRLEKPIQSPLVPSPQNAMIRPCPLRETSRKARRARSKIRVGRFAGL